MNPSSIPLVSVASTAAPDLETFRRASTVDEIVQAGRLALDDLAFTTVRSAVADGRPAIACFPVYTPQELLHALGFLPVTIHGGGENLELTKADAALGSFLCSISKSTLELALTARLDPFSAFVFPYICDVSRNLEGVMSRHLRGKPTYMLHLPQNFTSRHTLPFLTAEYQRLIQALDPVAPVPFDPARLIASIRLFNEQRELVQQLNRLKREKPWLLSLEEHYVLRRLGTLLPREVHIPLLRKALSEIPKRKRVERDAVRVLVVGPYCEQPPRDLLQLIEDAGCYVVADELQMNLQWHGPVDVQGDPLRSLAQAYIRANLDIGVRYTPTTKAEAILKRATDARAQGVVFVTAKFCEPALEDIVLYERALASKGIPTLQLEFEERSSGLEQARLAVETFVESILFA